MHLLVPELARDRAAALAQERRRYRSLSLAVASQPRPHRHRIRRLTAVVLARISLASAAAVRRLDACIADDLVRPMSGSHGA